MLKIDIEVKGARASADVLASAPMEAKQAASKEMHATARKLADEAQGNAVMHPSGLWDGISAAAYRVKKKSLLSIGVNIPSGPVWKAEAISEFAHGATTPQGKAMVSVLDATYGRMGGSGEGRVLWRAYDDSEGAYVSAMKEVIDRYAADLERRL